MSSACGEEVRKFLNFSFTIITMQRLHFVGVVFITLAVASGYSLIPYFVAKRLLL